MFLTKFFKRLLKTHSDTQVLENLEKLEKRFAQLRADNELFKADVIEAMLPKIEKISKRMETRMRREEAREEQDLDLGSLKERTYHGIHLYGGGKK